MMRQVVRVSQLRTSSVRALLLYKLLSIIKSMSEEGSGHSPFRPGQGDMSSTEDAAGLRTAACNGSTSSADGRSSESRITQLRRTSQLIVPDGSGDGCPTAANPPHLGGRRSLLRPKCHLGMPWQRRRQAPITSNSWQRPIDFQARHMRCGGLGSGGLETSGPTRTIILIFQIGVKDHMTYHQADSIWRASCLKAHTVGVLSCLPRGSGDI